MSRLLAAAAMVLAVLVPGVPLGSASAAPAPAKPTRLGLSYGDTLSWMTSDQLDDALDDAVRLHVRWIRADLQWSEVEALPGVYDWSRFDRVVAAARARHLRVLPILTYTPAWARRPDCARFSCAPRRISDFVDFAKAAVRRYAPSGVRDWEIWNEPNLRLFWAEPNATRYGRLLKAATRAIKRIQPTSTVLLGGLAGIDPSWSPGSIDPRDFLAQVCATGACDRIDAVAYHPYTYPYLASSKTSFGTAWERMVSTPYSLRSVLRASGHADLKIWATEYGAPTGGPGTASDGSPGSVDQNTDHVTEDWQAVIARDAVQTAVRSRKVVALFWYTDRDNPAATGREAYFGLRRSDGSRKPAWSSFRQAVIGARR